MTTKSYILEIYYAGRWNRFYIDCAWPTRRAAVAYCQATLSVNDWARARIVSSDLPVSLPDHVAANPRGYMSPGDVT